MTQTTKDVIQELVTIYTEIETLLSDAKEILDAAKEQGLDQAMIAKVAKAQAQMKLEDVREKTDKLLKFIDENTD